MGTTNKRANAKVKNPEEIVNFSHIFTHSLIQSSLVETWDKDG